MGAGTALRGACDRDVVMGPPGVHAGVDELTALPGWPGSWSRLVRM